MLVSFILNFFRSPCASAELGPIAGGALELLCVRIHDVVTKQLQSIPVEANPGVPGGLHFQHHPPGACPSTLYVQLENHERLLLA